MMAAVIEQNNPFANRLKVLGFENPQVEIFGDALLSVSAELPLNTLKKQNGETPRIKISYGEDNERSARFEGARERPLGREVDAMKHQLDPDEVLTAQDWEGMRAWFNAEKEAFYPNKQLRETALPKIAR